MKCSIECNVKKRIKNNLSIIIHPHVRVNYSLNSFDLLIYDQLIEQSILGNYKTTQQFS